MRFVSAVLAVFVFAAVAAAQSSDRIRLTSGSSEAGEITKMTPIEVSIKRGNNEKQIAVTEIRSIIFQDEPGELTQARLNAINTSYQQALDQLGAINPRELTNTYVKQDVEFYRAWCEAKLALLGERPINEAGAKLGSFVNQYRQSYHFLAANELLGDLLVAAGKFDAAQTQYELLGRAPWPSYQKRAGVLVGNSLIAQKEFQDARAEFDKVLAIADETREGKSQTLAAQLGKAITVAALGDVDQGIKSVEQVVRDADPEDVELLAAAYNALGACHQQAGSPKEALFAYLHVDLLYRRAAEHHAEALFHLASLWQTVGQEGEARAARTYLKEQYPGTRWARQLGG